MTDHPSLPFHDPCVSSPMREAISTGDDPASLRELTRLEAAHYEICTALTVLRSNVELVRIELRHEADASTTIAVQQHLTELDAALDRLRRLAAQMRTWRAVEPPAAPGAADVVANTSLLP